MGLFLTSIFLGVLVGDFPFPTFLADGGADGAVVVPPELGEFAVDVAEAFPAFFGVGILFQQGHGQAGHFGGEDGGEAVAEEALLDGVVQVIGLLGELEGGLAGFLAAEPFDVAGLFPVGEVLFADGASGEVLCKDGLDVGLLVEPGDDFRAGLAVFDAAAEFVAAGFGEPADFSDMCHIFIYGWRLARVGANRGQFDTLLAKGGS